MAGPGVGQAILPFFDFMKHCLTSTGRRPGVHYCPSPQTTETACKKVEFAKVLGFDVEWKPDFSAGEKARGKALSADDAPALDDAPKSRMDLIKENISVILLASRRDILIIHVARFEIEDDDVAQLIPPTLRKILESPDIIKTGTGIEDPTGDGNRIEQWLGFKVNGMRDTFRLQHAINGTLVTSGARFGGLAGLTRIHLGFDVEFKDKRGQTSQWQLRAWLTADQFKYAANDAIIPLQLYKVLSQQMVDRGLDIDLLVPVGSSKYVPTPRKGPKISGEQGLQKDKKIEAMDSHTRTLYDQLLTLRNTLMSQHGFSDPSLGYRVADTKTLINLATKKPTTAEELKALPGLQKGTKGEYLYDFLNAVQTYLGVHVDVEPAGWKAEALKLKMARKAVKESEAAVEALLGLRSIVLR